jgi:hypothetical protein
MSVVNLMHIAYLVDSRNFLCIYFLTSLAHQMHIVGFVEDDFLSGQPLHTVVNVVSSLDEGNTGEDNLAGLGVVKGSNGSEPSGEGDVEGD